MVVSGVEKTPGKGPRECSPVRKITHFSYGDEKNALAVKGRHLPSQELCAAIMALKSRNRYWGSLGPGAASGWYCTLNTGSVLWAMPSTV